MPNAKAMAGSTRLGQCFRVLRDQWLATEVDLERLGPSAIRGAIPRPDRIGRRLRDPRHLDHGRDPRTGTPRLFRPERAAVSITTSLPEISVTSVNGSPTAEPEPEILRRERAVLREILGLVADRAAAEAEVEATRARADATADSEYERTRRTLQEKIATWIARPDRPTSNAGGRSSKRPCAARPTRSRSSPPPAVGSPWSSTSSASQPATTRGGRGARRPPASTPAQLKAAKEHSEAIRPVLDLAALADSHRERLAAIAADYVKLKLDPEPPPPTEEDLTQLRQPARRALQSTLSHGSPAQAARGAAHPQADEGDPRGVGLHPRRRVAPRDRASWPGAAPRGSAAASPPGRPRPSCSASGS